MFPKRYTLVAASLAAAVCSSLSFAAPIVVDGNLADWGINVADGNESDFYHLKNDIGLVGYLRSDQSDNGGDAGALAHGTGGQNYDAEFLGAAVQGSTLYLALVSGQRPDNGFDRYAPGDIFIITDTGLFGIELGGGAGNAGARAAAIGWGAGGSTYGVDADGHTVSYSDAAAAQIAGSVWTNVIRIWDPSHSRPTQFSINGASIHAGDAEYAYTRDDVTGQHAIIELALDTSLFGDNTLWGVTWAPAGYNDDLFAQTNIPTHAATLRTQQVPEPNVAALFGLGVAAMGMLRLPKRRRS